MLQVLEWNDPSIMLLEINEVIQKGILELELARLEEETEREDGNIFYFDGETTD